MRIFQNSGVYPTYQNQFNATSKNLNTFNSRKDAFLEDRFGACHYLKPVIEYDDNAFFTNGDDAVLQRLWADENGISPKSSLEDILLCQLEDHRTEVFYNLDPIRYPSKFLKRLPGSVKRSIAWRAAPFLNVDISAYDKIVCNFPSILAKFQKYGCNTAYFWPSHDPEMDSYALNSKRNIDVLFIGGYSRHHSQRAQVLEAVAALAGRYNIKFHLDQSRFNTIAESVVGNILPLSKYRRPMVVRNISNPPVFGRELYKQISNSKIVVNGAIDMAGQDRGNMRCFETLGCKSLLLSDEGNYPDEMISGHSHIVYNSANNAVELIVSLLNSDADRCKEIANTGYEMIRSYYSKSNQWRLFNKIIE